MTSENEPLDWIELFCKWTDGIPSPRIFRQWAAISCIAGALERRIHAIVAGKQIFPNLYVLLVGTPGIGKTQAIEHVNELWTEVSDLHVAPHDVTKAALVDELSRASCRRVKGDAHLIEYNSLLVAADEFGVLVPSYDTDFLSTLNRIFDNPAQHRQNRRGLQEQVDIVNPQLNIIGGVQPAYLANLLPEEAWGMGFMSRVIMVHSAEKKKVRMDLIRFNGEEIVPTILVNSPILQILILRLRKMAELYGRMDWREDAARASEKWNDEGLPPVPEHSKMEHYNTRRLLHVVKLCIISAISAGHQVIELTDFTRAKDWLLEVEQEMPDIFREMVQRSDAQVLEELHAHIWKIWVKDKGPVHEVRLVDFLKTRATSDKVQKIIDIAVRSGMLTNCGMSFYLPRPKHEHGLE
jgi:hypothetical protein